MAIYSSNGAYCYKPPSAYETMRVCYLTSSSPDSGCRGYSVDCKNPSGDAYAVAACKLGAACSTVNWVEKPYTDPGNGGADSGCGACDGGSGGGSGSDA